MSTILTIHRTNDRMNFAALDLNLLVALQALLAEGHVGRAASRVGLSQPAMSHALRRLRETTGDPLLVRVGAQMELTERAKSLRAPLNTALEQVRGLFAPEAFDPKTSERRFKMLLPDIVVDLLLAPLTREVAKLAPGITLDVAPWRGPSVMTREFAREIDIVVACLADAFPGFHRQLLYRDSDALAVRRGHKMRPRLKRLDAFLAARHVAVVTYGLNEDMIDTWLRSKRLERRIALAVPGYLEALHIAANTDLVAFVPRRLIEASKQTFGLELVPPPVDPGIDEQYLFYPTRAQMDPGSIWLRKQLLAIGAKMEPR
jgi:DNA-binding transcriptional LysR family regulator